MPETDERLATEVDRRASLSEGAEGPDLHALGLDFGDIVPRVEHIHEDGKWVVSQLSEYGQKLADASARNPRGWDHTTRHGFNPYAIPKRQEQVAYDAATAALEKLFAPHLRDFRS